MTAPPSPAPRRAPTRRPPRRPVRRTPTLGADDLAELFEIGRDSGLDLVGACRAAAWTSTRSNLEARKAAGLNSTMAFTFKNPARSTDPTRVLKNASTLIVGARSYLQASDGGPGEILERSEVPAQVARYAAADHYGRLTRSLEAVAAALRERGARAVVVLDRNDIVDREAAWRAGIGWFGKNSLLLSPGWGSWLVLGSVVTDAAIVDHTPAPIADHCGPCRRCIDACPTRAIVADGVVDAGRCLSWLLQDSGSFPLEHREALGDRIYGCDDCQVVCPPNRAVELRSARLGTAPADERSVDERSTDERAADERAADDPGRWVGALQLLALGDAELLERCARWYIAGRDPRIVRRNLLIILGNAARPDDEAAVAALERVRAGDDALLAEHAAWALGRLRSRSDRRSDPSGANPGDTGTSAEVPRQ